MLTMHIHYLLSFRGSINQFVQQSLPKPVGFSFNFIVYVKAHINGNNEYEFSTSRVCLVCRHVTEVN